ncbi:hypothetical protein [Nocardiopsis synnemataformans]|uniref:hypothetical protein n=1 Tax=Nocardiopsis synnemataformans TaxID=61305 RepID=UPI003EB96A41
MPHVSAFDDPGGFEALIAEMKQRAAQARARELPRRRLAATTYRFRLRRTTTREKGVRR